MTEQPTNRRRTIEEINTLDIEPETGVGLTNNVSQLPEQPNTELLIVKTIQGLMSAASRELTELNKITSIAKHKVLIDQVLEDIDSTEKTTLFELQKALE